MAQTRVTRRRFLKASAALGAVPLLGRLALPDEKPAAAEEKLRVGVIGVSGQGDYDMSEAAAGGAEIVALCDVDQKRAEAARKRFPQAAFYTDFRRLLEQKGLEGVVIATPDHTHAICTMHALQAGLHVYCEKPLTHTVEEARMVAETAAREKRVTQMGTQIHAGGNYRRVVELVQSGAIGAVAEVHVWCATSYPAGDRPKETPPVPEGLDYDLWLGPAPFRPYHPSYLPFNWRRWWDFGGGALADMACHYMDLPFWALKLRHPTRVAAEGPPVHPEGSPEWLIVRYQFPARGELPPVKLTWYDGKQRPPHMDEGLIPKWGSGVLFVGEKGMLVADYGNHKLLPEEKFSTFERPKHFIPDSIGHHREWVQAAKEGGTTTCNFDYSGALAEAVLLGVVSYRAETPLEWDAKLLKAANAPQADRFIRHEYRKGWTLERPKEPKEV
jgi:predicted dehydrogenase